MSKFDTPRGAPQEFSLEMREKIEKLHSVTLFIVRHGETRYLERQHVMKTGKWNPDLPDLKPKGEPNLVDTAQYIGKQLDPKTHIVVFFSSPRARTLRSKEIVERQLKGMGFEVFEEDPTEELLRSGGDNSPLVGIDRELKFPVSDPNYFALLEDMQETKGNRLKEFLGAFAAMDKQFVTNMVSNIDKFHGKIPVFIAVTHGEVTHAGINPEEQYRASLLGTAFPDGRRHKLLRGKGMRLDFDLEHPGDFSLELPAEANPAYEKLAQKIHLDPSGVMTKIENKPSQPSVF